jgi:uncharacterized protein YkvS
LGSHEFPAIDAIHNGCTFAQRGALNIRLTKKLAQALNGLDLSKMRVGEVIDLQDPLARMLIAERWAEEIVAVDVTSTSNDRDWRAKRKAGRRNPRSNVAHPKR